MKRFSFLVLSVVLVLLALSCAPREVPVPQAAVPAPRAEGAAPAPAAAAPSKASWEAEWDRVVEAGKKEGKVVLYSTAGVEIRTAVIPAFRKKFGIDVEAIMAKGAEVSEKLMSERRAGLYLADVYNGGTTTPTTQLKPAGALDPLDSALILPEVTDPKAWYGDDLRWVDPKHTVLSFLAYPNTNIVVNATVVKPEDIKSYKDLLNPKFKGKIVMNDPTLAGTGSKTFSVIGEVYMGWDFWREFATKQEPVIIRDQRLQIDWVAKGKYPIGLFPKTSVVTEFKTAGTPLDYIMPIEGTYLSSGSGNLALVNRAAHPNAAKVFINWLLSKEGQTIFSRAYGSQSARVDVPTEGIEADKIRQPGVKYFLYADTEEWLAKEVERMKLSKEIFGALMK